MRWHITSAVIILLLLQGQINTTFAFIHSRHKKCIFKSATIERNYRLNDEEDTTNKKISQKILSTFKIKYRSYKEKRTQDNDTSSNSIPSGLKINGTGSTMATSNTMPDVHELRDALFNKGLKLEQIEGTYNPSDEELNGGRILDDLLNHEVLKLISYRYQTKSKPGKRAANDTAILALSIEGGGMRGAVSAGMAAAIGCLGLCDTFDSIYGSSAGSVIGAYMVSRQLCVDVYTDVLVAAKKTFVSKRRIISSLLSSLMTEILTSSSSISPSNERLEGMNISFVLDGILSSDTGLRPLDIDTFYVNDKVQPLNIVSSVVRNVTLDTISFNSKAGDFSNVTKSIRCIDNSTQRNGLFACLQASMTVPGATGPPVQILRAKDNCTAIHHSFDAFCFEPIPYRSAVQDGATHVLVLRSRPNGSPVKTKPGVYEKTVAPLYFNRNKLPNVAKYFKEGGQQFRYLEDFMTLDEGLRNQADGERKDGVLVSPTEIIYGAPEDHLTEKANSVDITTWKKAHLLPIVVPRSKPELAVLEQGKDEVLNAVRDGFAAAFDLLAPIVISDLDNVDTTTAIICNNTSLMNGDRVAKLIFPRKSIDTVLDNPVHVKGEVINRSVYGEEKRCVVPERLDSSPPNLNKLQQIPNSVQFQYVRHSMFTDHEHPSSASSSSGNCSRRDATTLLSCLPGLRFGKLSHLADGLHWHIRS